ncbi:MAG: ATP-dependent 6-phosphofructokinase [Eubacteriales bacterium]|nr:ATP-dependent 6-phosphofructokinase [Eubacteriales bacterium]
MVSERKKRIGVLTSGGDAPGMNAAIRAVVLATRKAGYEVMGIYEGYKGLVYDNMKLMYENDVDNIIDKSGTILYSDRCDEFSTHEGMVKAAEVCRKNNICGLVVIGGDGTLSGATEFSMTQGIPCIGIPGTIDNDLVVSDYTVGYDTAMNTIISMADNCRYTCNSHRRCEVIEVMGRGAGDIALYTGIASGAQVILTKEVFFEKEKAFADTIAYLDELRRGGKRNFTVIVAEGIPLDIKSEYKSELAAQLAKDIDYYTGDIDPETEARRGADPDNRKIYRPNHIETKFVRLAHIVRGGIPTLRDRVTASRMGVMAVELLNAGENDKVICEQDGKLTAVDIKYAISADKIYKIMLNKKYYEAGMLNEGSEKDYLKYHKKYETFSAGMSDTDKKNLAAYAERKLAEFREVAAEASKITG